MIIKSITTILPFVCLILFIGCSANDPAEIHYGQDQCSYCKMNIVDKHFGSQLVTPKGKVYKFDSIECLAAFAYVSMQDKTGRVSMWVTDFISPGKFVRIDSATIVQNNERASPMGVGLVGFGSDSEASDYIAAKGGRVVDWVSACELVKTEWKL